MISAIRGQIRTRLPKGFVARVEERLYILDATMRPDSEFDVWLSGVRTWLPRVLVPLTPDEADIPLDLQAAFERPIEVGGYAETLDYSGPPTPPLAPEDADWADALLREARLKP